MGETTGGSACREGVLETQGHEKESGQGQTREGTRQSPALGSRPPGAWLCHGADPGRPLEARPSPVPPSTLLDTDSTLKQ